jgi:Calcineurin-like phosphoesterase
VLGNRVSERNVPWRPRAPAGKVWAVGDIHGARPRLVELLNEAGIIGERNQWTARAATGVCIGDYFNRGEDGAGVVELLRRLQGEAHAAGGQLLPLLGNHDVLMSGVLTERRATPYGEVASLWLLNGGRFLDLEAMERDPAAEAWVRRLPAMLLLGDTLYVHSDTVAYLELGQSVDEVNAAVQDTLVRGDLARIVALFDLLSRRGELRDPACVDRLLKRFGGERLVHGHSPFFGHEPAVSHGGRCINVEGGLWDSDESDRLGFVYWAA